MDREVIILLIADTRLCSTTVIRVLQKYLLHEDVELSEEAGNGISRRARVRALTDVVSDS